MTKERPILFSGAMVRAILDGRKTQTRRIIKLPPAPETLGTWEPTTIGGGSATFADGSPAPEMAAIWHTRTGEALTCRHGQAGDRLWVRETWQGPMWDGELEDRPADAHSPKYCQYAADGGPIPEYMDAEDNLRQGWRPSIHMPRWACRLELEITGVRVERLNDCSEEDAIAEGIAPELDGWTDYSNPSCQMCMNPVDSYRTLWNCINGVDAWDTNPFVWVVEFRRAESQGKSLPCSAATSWPSSGVLAPDHSQQPSLPAPVSPDCAAASMLLLPDPFPSASDSMP